MDSFAKLVVLLTALCFIVSDNPASARILDKCEAARQVHKSKLFEKSLYPSLVCIMMNESKYNTSLVRGPLSRNSCSYGIFQINSQEYCNQYRNSGHCKKQCKYFANDDIQDDIKCVKTISDRDGFKYFPTYRKNCLKNLPNLSDCQGLNLENEEIEENQKDLIDELDTIGETVYERPLTFRKWMRRATPTCVV